MRRPKKNKKYNTKEQKRTARVTTNKTELDPKEATVETVF